MNWKRLPFARLLKDDDSETRSAFDRIESQFARAIMGRISQSGVTVTPQKAMGVATVYACVNVLSKTIATLPLQVYERVDDNTRRLATDSEIYDLLHTQPNSEMTSTDFRMAVNSHLVLRNNAYAQIVRSPSGVVELVPIEPDRVSITRNERDTLRYKVEGYDGTFAVNDMIHLKGYTRTGLTGEDLIVEVGDVIGLAKALDINASNFFKNDSKPGTVFTHPGALSDKAYERLRSELEKKHGGLANSYKMILLEEGMKAESTRSENRDSQFDESRLRQSHAICSVFGVPPHKVGIVSNQPRANVEQENISFVTDTIRPLCVVWEQALNMRLFDQTDRRRFYVEFDLSGLLRGDIKSRFDAYSKARQWGWLSVNEIRRKENMNPIGADGDTYMQPLNMQALGQQSPEEE